MTLDEAINELKEDIELYIPLHGTIDDVDRELPDGRLITALEMAIKALEQQPCEDCIRKQDEIRKAYDSGIKNGLIPKETCEDAISRKEIYFKLTNGAYPNESIEQFIDRLVKELEALPPVTPQPKTGRWISFGTQGEIDGQIVRAFTCSKCGAISIFRVSNGNIVNGDLCPNCGAKMQAESEDKDADSD